MKLTIGRRIGMAVPVGIALALLFWTLATMASTVVTGVFPPLFAEIAGAIAMTAAVTDQLVRDYYDKAAEGKLTIGRRIIIAVPSGINLALLFWTLGKMAVTLLPALFPTLFAEIMGAIGFIAAVADQIVADTHAKEAEEEGKPEQRDGG